MSFPLHASYSLLQARETDKWQTENCGIVYSRWPMNWLFKEEPTSYSFETLKKDGHAVWAGVRTPLAQKHLRGVKKGDRIFYSHTGNEKAGVGIAKAASDAY